MNGPFSKALRRLLEAISSCGSLEIDKGFGLNMSLSLMLLKGPFLSLRSLLDFMCNHMRGSSYCVTHVYIILGGIEMPTSENKTWICLRHLEKNGLYSGKTNNHLKQIQVSQLDFQKLWAAVPPEFHELEKMQGTWHFFASVNRSGVNWTSESVYCYFILFVSRRTNCKTFQTKCLVHSIVFTSNIFKIQMIRVHATTSIFLFSPTCPSSFRFV